MGSSEKPIFDEAEVERIMRAMGTKIDLTATQAEVAQWSHDNFGDQPAHRPLLGVGEEVGELMHAHLKLEQGIRLDENLQVKRIDAVGDIVVYLMDYCSRVGISIEHAIALAWSEVKARNWKKSEQKELGL